jgi:tetratricopeptide (TPR) repeat protein
MKRLCHFIGPMLLMVLVLGATGGCTRQARAKRLLKTANSEFNAGKYDNAEVEYKNVRRLDGLNPTAIGQLGRLYAKGGRLAEARAYLLKATELQPNSLAFQLALGQVDVSVRDFTNAAKIARRILTAQPANEEALMLLVDSSRDPRQLRQEMQSLPRAAENPAYHLALGTLALREKNLDDAGNELRLAVAANPKSSQAYFALAELASARKNGKEMGQALQRAAELAPPRSPIRLKYADYMMQNGAVDAARKILQEMSQNTPDYIPGWIALMNLAMAEKQYDDAATFAETVLDRDQRNYDALLCRGTVSLVKGDAARAAAQFEHMDSIYKKSPQVKCELAAASLMARDKVKAVEYLNQALALDPGYAQAALLLAQIDLRGGDPAAAVALLTRLVKKAPATAQAYFLLADAYLAQQKPDSAIAVYRSLAGALPKNPQIPLLMGGVLAGQRKDSEARAAFEKCLELAPDYLPAVQQLIHLDLAAHNYKDATALAQAQITKSPKAAEPWQILARIDVAQTNLARAETDLLKALDLNPDLPGSYLMLADVYVATGNNQEALQKLNALVARTNDAPAYLQIGAIHEKLKQYDQARDAYEKVLTINSNSAPALNNLAYIYAVQLNNIDRAYELAQKARDLTPYNPNAGDTLGWILFKKGDYARALTVLQDSAERAPADAEIQFHLGMVHYMMGEEDAARVALQRAVASQQDYANKDEARSRLAVLNMDVAGAGASVVAGLEKALQDHPDDPVILNRIAMLQERQGAFEKAAASYETALKRNPEAVRIMAKLARLYALRLNQPEKALSLAKAAHKLAPDNADVSAILGHLVYRSDDYVYALSLLESAADRLPNQPDLLYDLAWAYYGVGRVADAETAMQKALRSGVAFDGSEDAKRFVALADAFGSASKVQAGLGQARQILQSEAKYVPALMVSGAAEERAGHFKAAQEAYDQALAVFPLFAPAARQLTILDARHFSDDAKGYALGEKARTAYPDDPEVAASLGILSYYQAKYPRSAELLREGMAATKDDGELYYYLGMDYYQLKRARESQQALERAIALKIPDTQAAEAKRILAGMK